jgi:nucleoside phosphorylase
MKNYRDQCRPVPEIKYGLVVSGSSVVADVAQIEEIMARQSGAIGLEMEIFGIYTAVQKSIGSKKPAVLGIKGVADFGDGEKHDHIQAHASILSFYTMLALLRKLYGDGHLEAVQ